MQSLPSADGDFIRGASPAGSLSAPAGLSPLDKAVLGGLALLSAALLFWATRDAVLAAGFLAALARAGSSPLPLASLAKPVATAAIGMAKVGTEQPSIPIASSSNAIPQVSERIRLISCCTGWPSRS